MVCSAGHPTHLPMHPYPWIQRPEGGADLFSPSRVEFQDAWNYVNMMRGCVNIVAYRVVVKRWLCKQWPSLRNASNNRITGSCNPFLGNGSVRTFLRKRTCATIEERCFRSDPSRGGILKAIKLAVESNSAREVEKR
jgi:hypothetical protein